MAKTLTARFGMAGSARNAHEDLIDTGYPSDKVYLDSDKAEVKVISSAEGEREAREILERHKPSEITETEF